MTVFKAKLVEDERFFTWRRIGLYMAFIPALLPGLLLDENQEVLLIIGIAVDLVIGGVMIYMSRRIRQNMQDSGLQASDRSLSVWGREGTRTWELGEGVQLRLTEGVNLDLADLKDIWREMKGNTRKNILEVIDGKETHKMTFLIDSYYMLEQLKKLAEEWEKDGVLLTEKISEKNE